LKKAQGQLKAANDVVKQAGNRIQFYQEIGGLVGRILLAILAVVIVSPPRIAASFSNSRALDYPICILFTRHRTIWSFSNGVCLLPDCFTGRAIQLLGKLFATCLSSASARHWREFCRECRGPNDWHFSRLRDHELLAPMMNATSSYHKIAMGAALMALLVYGIGLGHFILVA